MKYRLPPKIPPGNAIAVDTETTGLNVRKGDQPYIISFCNEDGETCVFEWPVDPFTRCVKASPRDLKILRPWFGDPNIAKVFHNSNFDLSMIEVGLGIPVRGQIHDTMIAMHCWRSYEKSYGLKELANKYLEFDDDDEKALRDATIAARRKAKSLGWSIADDVEPDYWLLMALDPKNRLCRVYADRDAQRTMLLWMFAKIGLDQDGTWDTYEDEMQVCRALGAIGHRGIRIDL